MRLSTGLLLVLLDEFLDFLPEQIPQAVHKGSPRQSGSTQQSCLLVISSPFSSSKRIIDILFLFVDRCYVLGYRESILFRDPRTSCSVLAPLGQLQLKILHPNTK